MLETENTINQTDSLGEEHDCLFTGIDTLIDYYRKNSITEDNSGKILLVKTLPNGEPLNLSLRSRGIESPLHKPWNLSPADYRGFLKMSFFLGEIRSFDVIFGQKRDFVQNVFLQVFFWSERVIPGQV